MTTVTFLLRWLLCATTLILSHAEPRVCDVRDVPTLNRPNQTPQSTEWDYTQQTLEVLEMKMSHLDRDLRLMEANIQTIKATVDIAVRSHAATKNRPYPIPISTRHAIRRKTMLNNGIQIGHGYLVPNAAEEEMHAKTLLRHEYGFYDAFNLQSVVMTDSELKTMTIRPAYEEKMAELLILTDALGKLYVFTPQGDLLQEYNIETHHAVTTILVHPAMRNVSAVVTCHANNEIRVHRMHVTSRSTHPKNVPNVKELELNDTFLINGTTTEHPVSIFTARVNSQRRYFISFPSGRLVIVGSTDWMIMTDAVLPSRVMDSRTDSNTLFLGHQGGVMTYSRGKLRDLNCWAEEDVNLEQMVFDVDRSSRAFGIDSKQQLITITFNVHDFECRIRNRIPIRLKGTGHRLQSLKGYLLLTSTQGFAVLNTTLSLKHGPREVIRVHLSAVTDAIGLQINHLPTPMMTALARTESYFALHLSGGIVAVFKSQLQVQPLPESIFSSLYRPMVILAVVMVLGWRFWKKAHEQQQRRQHENDNERWEHRDHDRYNRIRFD